MVVNQHGWINDSIEALVLEKFGLDIWAQVKLAAGCEIANGAFVRHQYYDAALTYARAINVGKVLNLDLAVMVRPTFTCLCHACVWCWCSLTLCVPSPRHSWPNTCAARSGVVDAVEALDAWCPTCRGAARHSPAPLLGCLAALCYLVCHPRQLLRSHGLLLHASVHDTTPFRSAFEWLVLCLVAFFVQLPGACNWARA